MTITTEDLKLVGGSDVAAILGLSPWATPFSVWARIVGGAQGEESIPKARGKALEAAVLALYAEETGAELLGAKKLQHPAMPFTRASLDSMARREGRRVVEAKTSLERSKWGEPGTDVIPEPYLYQCTWYSGVALANGVVDVPEVDVAALVAGELGVYHVRHDPELFGLLEEAVRRFWVDYVEPMRPPPLSEPWIDLGAVNRMHPRHDGDARHWDSLGPAEQVAVREWLQARRERQEAAAREAEWEARAKLALGTAPQLVGLRADTGVGRIDWKQNKASKDTDWRTVALEAAASREELDKAIRRNTTEKPGARPFVARPLREEP